jgi:hypothetical protein
MKLPEQGLFRRLPGHDAALRKLPASLTHTATEKNLAVIATDNNSYVGPESFRINVILHFSIENKN